MEVIDAQVDQATDSLRSEFVKTLPDRFERIESHWRALLSSGTDKVHITNFVGAIHYIAGGASVHGFIAMSRLAYRIIAYVQPSVDVNVPLTKKTSAIIEKMLPRLYKQELHDGIDRAPLPEVEVTNEIYAPIETSNEVFVLEQGADEEHALKAFIESADLQMRSFKSLHQLHEAWVGSPPCAIMLDLKQCSDDETGSALMAELQQERTSFPVFIVSDSPKMDARLQATQMGATHFFAKPVDGYRLLDALRKATNIETTSESRVLIVDDDPQTAKFIGLHLRMQGLNVQLLHNPMHVLDVMAQFHPDLVLTDLYMPECSGLEMASIIRQHEVFFDVPIAFLTSEEDPQTRLAALSLGTDDYFSKSTDTAIVAEAIKSKLARMAAYAQVKKAMIWSPN